MVESVDVIKSRSLDGMLLGDDAGATAYVHVDETEKTFTHEIVQDVEPYLNHVKALKLEAGRDAGKSKSGELRHAGSYPPVIVQGWLNSRGLSLKDLRGDILKEFVNDPAHAAFRVWEGRV